MPYYQDNHIRIFNKDCRSMSELPDESVQCVVTSPPYWGLRKYSGEQELIWGGDEKCEHQWADVVKTDDSGDGHYTGRVRWQHVAQEAQDKGIHVRDVVEGAWAKGGFKTGFCSLCGAWRGQLGLEPTPELYLQHCIEILREIRRVLRKDGVCFLNLGDSYAGSWGSMSHDLEGKAKRASTNERPPQSYIGVQRGGQSGKRDKELLDLKVHDFFSENPCGECVRTLLSHNPDKYDYPSLALAVSSVLSNRSRKEQPIDHSGSSGSASLGDHNEGDTLGLCSFAKFLDGVAHGVQESTNLGVSAEFPQCPLAQSYWDSPSLREIILPELHHSNDGVCPFWLYLLSHGIQGLTESISGTLEIDGASAVRIRDKAFGSFSYPYSIIPQHHPKLKPKDMCLIPFRVAIVAQEDGWWVRSVILWSKPNPMPESVNGWRWARHRIKVKAQDYSQYHQPSKVSSGEVSGQRRNRDAIGGVWQGGAEWRDCPGCPKCLANDGLWLYKGSWRPTESHEYIIMLTKSDQYYSDAEAVREPYSPTERWGGDTYKGAVKKGIHGEDGGLDRERSCFPGTGRNLRSVWTFPTEPFPSFKIDGKEIDHFAVFPEKLPELCIKAATPEVGCCSKCGAPWVRVVKSRFIPQQDVRDPAKLKKGSNKGMALGNTWGETPRGTNETKTIGWRPTCKCNAPRVPSLVLDPMMGAGTTLWVAKKLNRKAVGYELSQEYCQLALERCRQQVLL